MLAKIVVAFCMTALVFVYGIPVGDMGEYDNEDETTEFPEATFNDSSKDLYVVKSVVYEVGILTDAADNETSFESKERVDLTFFDAHSNSSHIDLGNIPLPIQTNVSGQVLTGIAPVNIGAFSNPSELLATLPLTGTIVNITNSDTGIYQLTKQNVSGRDQGQIMSSEELSLIANPFQEQDSVGEEMN